MKSSEVLARLNSLNLGIIGAGWTPAVSDVAVARKVLAYLEDRRVLYDPTDIEVLDHCIISVIEIRSFLTDVLGQGGLGEDLANHLGAVRAAGRQFLQSQHVDPNDKDLWRPDIRRHHYRSNLEDFRLNQGLGELRATFGIHIGIIAAKYDLDLEDQLASILPPADTE